MGCAAPGDARHEVMVADPNFAGDVWTPRPGAYDQMAGRRSMGGRVSSKDLSRRAPAIGRAAHGAVPTEH